MPSYRRNPALTPQWNAEAGGSVELLDARSGRVFRVRPGVLGLLNQMPGFRTPENLEFEGRSTDDLAALLAKMAAAGLVESGTEGTGSDGPHVAIAGADAGRSVESPDLLADRGEWSACELAVHAQSARGGKAAVKRSEIPPARLTHPEALGVIELPDAPERSLPFAEVLAARRSVRDYASESVPLPLLAGLLDRAARVRGWLGPDAWQTTSRPSAGGGGRHSLELYLVIRDVAGLAAGAYHYDPFAHTLSLLAPWDDELDGLQRRLLCTPMGVDDPPPVSLYLASYYRRSQCKYGGMTLSLIYRDTGCLLQTLYLAATDLGLAGCATAAMEATPSPGFLAGRRDAIVHTGNFAVGLTAPNRPHDPEFRRL